LTADERSLLDALLAQNFPGVEALRLQAESVEAKRGCQCGCGTIALVVTRDQLPRSDASSPVPAEGEVFDSAGNGVGGLLLFLHDGFLASLEIYSNAEPLPLPAPETVRWVMTSR
jgi:hypothetical protein